MMLKRIMLFAFLASLALFGAAVSAQPQATRGPVLLTQVSGVIGPPARRQIARAIEEAEERGAEALILELNTPGGLETSTRDIVQDILGARVPVIGYVHPGGGRAASAGVYIMYATHLAAMTPGANIGAATPVELAGGAPAPRPPGGGGEEEGAEKARAPADPASSEAALERKIVNDAAAWIRSLAALRGRNAEWAEEAVRRGISASADEARDLRVVEIIADDLDDLLAQADGRTVTIEGAARTLALEGAAIERLEPGFITEMLGVLANPNVAFMLMLIGVYGLIFEFANPGSIGPGVIGAIALLLGLYALNQLPLNYAGALLILFGLGCMIAEAFTPTFGVLGIGGAAAFVIGASMLIDTDIPQYQLSWWVIGLAALLTGGFAMLAVGFTWRAHRRSVATGREALIDKRARVLDWAGGAGHVWIAGERWRAVGVENVSAGRVVRVVGVEDLTLRVADDAPQGDLP